MTLDFVSQMPFGNTLALRDFMLVHRFVHDAESKALTEKYGVVAGTFGLGSGSAEAAWAELMQGGEKKPTPAALSDWLQYHADMHNQAYSLLGSSAGVAPDLSVVDFSSAEQFYDWMQAHQEMHDFEQSALGIT